MGDREGLRLVLISWSESLVGDSAIRVAGMAEKEGWRGRRGATVSGWALWCWWTSSGSRLVGGGDVWPELKAEA